MVAGWNVLGWMNFSRMEKLQDKTTAGWKGHRMECLQDGRVAGKRGCRIYWFKGEKFGRWNGRRMEYGFIM
jgi:hypothetical protein